MKALLVLDTLPNSCGRCDLKELYDCWKCNVTGREIDIDCEVPRPSWCPLKPIIDDIKEEENDAYVRGFTDGVFNIVDEEDWWNIPSFMNKGKQNDR